MDPAPTPASGPAATPATVPAPGQPDQASAASAPSRETGTGPLFSDTTLGPGGLVFVSGQVPVAPDGSTPADVAAQSEVVLDRIEALLARHEIGLGDILQIRYFLTDRADLSAFRGVVLRRLPDPRPASTLAIVAGLVDPRFRIEVEAVAAARVP